MKNKTIQFSLVAAAALGLSVFLALFIMNSTSDPVEDAARRVMGEKSRAALSIFDEPGFNSPGKARTTRDEGPAHPDNPINPATGKRWSDAAMARFDLLRDELPGNRMIPRRLTRKERKEALTKEGKLARKYYVTTRIKILMGTAPRPVIDDYFNYRLRYTKDKVRLLAFAIRNLPEDAAPSRRARLQALLNENRLKLERALNQKRTAYEKSGISDQARL